MRAFLTVVALSAVFTGCASKGTWPPIQPGEKSADHLSARSELQILLERAISKGVPGISAAVATRDGVVWTGVAGKADLQTGAPVRPDMLFGIGSITKTFVAVVILQLAEEGRLDLNATAARLLGTAVEGIPNADKATIAQLLNHTAGVPSWEDDPAWIRDGRGATLDVSRTWGKTDTLRYIKGHAPLDAAGAKFSYANTDFTLLGMIVEQVTGQEAVGEIHRRILAPLGLKDVYLEGFEPVPQNRLPHRYHWATPEFRRNAGVNAAFPEVRPGMIDASRSNLSVEWTAGGMVATARDLALYGVALRDGRLLKTQSMKFMTEWFPVKDSAWFPAGGRAQVGHNVFRFEYPDGLAVIGHDGDVLGFTGCLYWLEGTDAVVAVVCNVGAMHSGDVRGVAYSVGKEREFIDQAKRVAANE
jgi:D-alanyl-D-alanine carboxypeptidase